MLSKKLPVITWYLQESQSMILDRHWTHLSWQLWPDRIEWWRRASYFVLLHKLSSLYIMDWRCSSYWSRVLRGLMGKLFIETVITGGEGIGFPFSNIESSFVKWITLTYYIPLIISVWRIIFPLPFESKFEGHIGEVLLLRGSFSQFSVESLTQRVMMSDEEWCSRYLWVISFGGGCHTQPQ